MVKLSARTKDIEDITKEEVLSKITQERIFETYLGTEIILRKAFKSPLREDRNPSCSFYYNGNDMLYFRDFTEESPHDCFSLVCKIYRISFHEAVRKIAYDFDLIHKNPLDINTVKWEREKIKKRSPKSNERSIKVKKKPLTEVELRYFNKAGISKNTLEKFKVFRCEKLWIYGTLSYIYNKEDPAVVYHLGGYNYKVYFYRRDSRKFLCSTNKLQGYEELPDQGKALVITKSMKDVLTLYQAGISSIAPQSENQVINQEVMDELRQRFGKIYTLFDYDLTGVRVSNKYKRAYNTTPLFITQSKREVSLGMKDAFDYASTFGTSKLKNLLKYEAREKEKHYGK